MLELAEKVLSIVGGSSKLIFKELPQADSRQFPSDITEVKSILRWEPSVQLDDRLSGTVKYFFHLFG